MGLLAKAKPIAAPKAAKATKAEINLPGLRTVAEIDALLKSLGALKVTVEAEVKAAAMDNFMEIAAEQGKRPESFRGVEDTASASVELRKRATTSPLTAEQLAMMQAAGLPTGKNVKTKKLFGINPNYVEDIKMMERVETVLEGLGLPDDFFVLQEEVSTDVVTDETLEKAFKMPTLDRTIIESLTVLALKPKLEVVDVEEIMKNVASMIKI